MSTTVKKSRPKISEDGLCQSVPPPSTAKWRRIERHKGWVVIGFDVSMSSIAGAAVAWDEILKKDKGPEFSAWRWDKNTHYFDRLTDCARSFEHVESLQAKLGVVIDPDDVFIAIEEPFPLGMVRRMESNALKQQAEISGAFIAGLLRYGYEHIFQIGNHLWRQVVAEALGISIHHTKWNYERNPFQFAPSGKGSGKWRSKEYGLQLGLPEWPDIISSGKHGKIPRPDGSKAKAVQPDDRFDAFAIMQWMRRERQRGQG